VSSIAEVNFYIRQGDLLPPIEATLKDGADQAVNLTGVSGVRFRAFRQGSTTLAVDAAATIVSETNGQVRYDWQSADSAVLAVPGILFGQWEVTSSSKVETFPNNTHIAIRIVADSGGVTTGYVTVPDLRFMLSQVEQSVATDIWFAQIIAAAERIVNDALGFTFADYGVTPTTKRVRAEKSRYLKLPPYKYGSITSIVKVNGVTPETTQVTDWEETEDKFHLYRDAYWTQNQRYEVTAIWGYGPAPESIKQLVKELSVNIWRSSDKGLFTEIIGADGGGQIRYIGGLNTQQRMVVTNVRAKFREVFH
jgi:hypothetical protein